MRPTHGAGRALSGARRREECVRIVVLAASAATMICTASPAAAVPAFAVQTGQPCQMCHIGAFGPQLTPFGRQFKLNGYTLRAGDTFTPPISAMAVASFVHTQKDRSEEHTSELQSRFGISYAVFC